MTTSPSGHVLIAPGKFKGSLSAFQGRLNGWIPASA